MVLEPIEAMIEKVKQISKNPIEALQKNEKEAKTGLTETPQGFRTDTEAARPDGRYSPELYLLYRAGACGCVRVLHVKAFVSS